MSQLKQKGKNGAPVAGGFVLIFTILIVTVLLVITGSIFSFVTSQIKISRDEYESSKALYAADTGIECVRFYQGNYAAFNTTEPEQTLNCGVGTMTAGIPSPGAECSDHDYATSTFNGFSNGSCALVSVSVRARSVVVNGVPLKICDIYIISSGRNSCSATTNLVERSRWENM